MESNRQDNTEELALVTPLTGKDKLVIAIIAVFAVALCIGLFFGIRYGIFSKNVNSALSLIGNTVQKGNTTFRAIVKSDTHVTELKGTLHHTKGRSRASCDIDYGNRAVSLFADTAENDAYFYIESETDSDNIHIDISGLRYFLGENNTAVDWKKMLADMSSENINLADYYNPDKIDSAVSDLKKKLTSPSALYGVITCSVKDGTYTVKTDAYKVFVFVAKSLRKTFVSDKSYKNLMSAINDEKQTLSSQTFTVRLMSSNSLLDSIDMYIGGEDAVSVSVALKDTGSTEPQSEFEANPELAEDVSVNTAYRIVLRSGLDTGSAYKEATMSLNAFAEFYSYRIVSGTIVIVYDEDGNDFRFIYTDKNNLEEIDYGDEKYSAWENGGYVALDTKNLDSGKYTVAIYEPGESMRTNSSSDDYNNAYIAALHACYTITGAHYEIPHGAIFLVKENGTDFQFGYDDGNLYDIYEQYYYVIYTNYSIANLSSIEGLPENVTLYLPSTPDADK